MNLSNETNGLAGENTFSAAKAVIFRQICQRGLMYLRLKMHSIVRAGNPAIFFVTAFICLQVIRTGAQTNYYSPNGGEYAVIGSVPGDQVTPSVAVSTNGGYLVWADNATDGSSWGISARKLDATLSGTLGAFRVNIDANGSQQNPKVALLKNGGAVIVWQGGQQGFQHIYARFLDAAGIFTNANDVLVCSSTNYCQVSPDVTVLNNGNVVVVWQSYNQAGGNSMQDVYGQILTPGGVKVGGEFLVNQFNSYNQRSPAIAAQPNGGFIVAWVTEQQRSATSNTNTLSASYSTFATPSVDICARYFNSSAAALGSEFFVNTGNNPCSNPSVAVAVDGSWLATWTARDLSNRTNSLDVMARTYNSAGVAGAVIYVNGRLYGDEYLSKVAAIGLDFLVTWVSLGQDGSREGIYGRHIHNNGAYNSGEFLVNTTTISQQMDPCVASDGNSQFVVVWRSFTGLAFGTDLFAQRYLNMQIGLPPMSAPYVWVPFVISNNVYQPQLVVTWAPLTGISVSYFEIYTNGVTSPAATTTTNRWMMTSANGLGYSSTNSFAVDYVTTDGRRAPLSPWASNSTWSQGNYYGVPYDWIVQYYGYNFANYPPATGPLAPGGLTLYQVFLSGGNPTNPATWLRQTMSRTAQGIFLNWTTSPGATYQVMRAASLTSGWSNYGVPRFAAGTSDSLNVGNSGTNSYFRIVLLR